MAERSTFGLFGILGCGAAAVLVSFAGCGDSTGDSTSTGTAQGGSNSGGHGSGNSGGDIFSTGGGNQGGEAPCAQQSEEATLVSQPVDIVFIIDNSGSMAAEIEEVEEQINANFATIIDAAMPAVDYRVIMLSDFGASSSRRICVAAPLGGIPDADMDGHCDTIPSQPVNTAKFFHHSVNIGSHDALCKFINNFATADEYNLQPSGFGSVLRDNAFKFIVVITDDGVSCSTGSATYTDSNQVAQGDTVAQQWDSAVLALSPVHFGADTMNRRYSFWSIVALAPYMPTGMKPYGDPHPPDATVAPSITGECTPGAEDPGTGYQSLSIMTGGYRYPTCGLDYTDIFTLMAQGVIAGAQVPCEFDIPDPGMGQTIDLDTIEVKYSSMGTPVGTFTQVPTSADCTPTSFYIDMNKIVLCPDACTTVQTDPDAKIDIAYGCEIDIQ